MILLNRGRTACTGRPGADLELDSPALVYQSGIMNSNGFGVSRRGRSTPAEVCVIASILL
jgi:hypothetical protein